MREFVTRTGWLDDQGHPFGEALKRNVLGRMNDDNQSDLAGITFSDHSDLVELWFTKFNPFQESGVWAFIPGWRRKVAELEVLREPRRFGN